MIFFRVDGMPGKFDQKTGRVTMADRKWEAVVQRLYDEFHPGSPVYTDPELSRTQAVMKEVGGEITSNIKTRRRYRRPGATPPAVN